MTASDGRHAIPGITGGTAEPFFHAPWQARAFALAVSLHETGLFGWSEWAEALGARLGRNTALPGTASAPDHAAQYYAAWLATLEEMLARRQVAGTDAVDAAAAQWQRAARATPHGTPIRYEAGAGTGD